MLDRPGGDSALGPDAASPNETRRSQARIVVFIALCVACLVVSVGAVIAARLRADDSNASALAEPPSTQSLIDASVSEPHLVFLQTPGDLYRRLGLVSLEALDGPRQLTAMRCLRVHMAAGQGLCLGQSS